MRSKSTYVCQQCGYESGKWFGRCPECQSWGGVVETLRDKRSRAGKASSAGRVGKKAVKLTSIPKRSTSRISTKISEFDRVLGGGLVSGQVVLVAGEPGIGKSTILLQVADKLAKSKNQFLYVSAEESSHQIALRAQRLGVKNKFVEILEETDIDSVIDTINNTSNLSGVVLDSIQTMTTTDLSGMAGSVGQVRECAYRIVQLAKRLNIPIFIVGHITKEGSVAGPAILMHIVDTVLWFEGDKSLTLRFMRAVKNRFGATDEVGIFSMEEKGLEPLSSPEKAFLTRDRKNLAGSSITSILQGSRPILVEIQSLVVPTKLAFPRRVAQGIDSKRLELLLAVLTRRCGLSLYEQDVFVNVAGGVNLRGDPSADLAVSLSVASAFLDKPFPENCVAIGEVGLLGDIREVVAQDKRIKESKRLAYKTIISSEQVKYLREAIRKYLR